jgi:SAM-dependent methyltransferase
MDGFQIAWLSVVTKCCYRYPGKRNDGLGAFRHYLNRFIPVQAEFDRLPLCDNQADLIIYNALVSLFDQLRIILREALRLLRADGYVVIIDTRFIMTSKWIADGSRTSAGFETCFVFDRMDCQARITSPLTGFGFNKPVGDVLVFYLPDYGLRWKIRPILARIRGSREPASFQVIVGNKNPA